VARIDWPPQPFETAMSLESLPFPFAKFSQIVPSISQKTKGNFGRKELFQNLHLQKRVSSIPATGLPGKKSRKMRAMISYTELDGKWGQVTEIRRRLPALHTLTLSRFPTAITSPCIVLTA
jgi:hypothetical protein